jgi:NTP pyrophosphatase (non-canonical NTP hydrolase)
MNQLLINEYIQWSEATFGQEYYLNVLMKLRSDEIWELRDAMVLKDRDNQAEELADCFLLLFKIAHLNGFNISDIEQAMAMKLIELHNRKFVDGKRIK